MLQYVCGARCYERRGTNPCGLNASLTKLKKVVSPDWHPTRKPGESWPFCLPAQRARHKLERRGIAFPKTSVEPLSTVSVTFANNGQHCQLDLAPSTLVCEHGKCCPGVLKSRTEHIALPAHAVDPIERLINFREYTTQTRREHRQTHHSCC